MIKVKKDLEIPSFKKDRKSIFLDVKSEDISRYVILSVRDPFIFSDDPAKVISNYMDKPRKVGSTCMFTTYTGQYKGTPVTVCSTGSGAPETELALMEFIMNSTKVDTIIRIGASGGFQEHVNVGEIVISSGAVRSEGSSKEYISIAYPAIANYEVLLAQIEAAEKLKVKYHVGITRSDDTMYAGLGRPSYKGYIQDEHRKIINYWKNAGILNIEREASVILTLTGLFGLRGGNICVVVDNYLNGELLSREELLSSVDKTIIAALDSFKILSCWDEAKKVFGKKLYFPSLK